MSYLKEVRLKNIRSHLDTIVKFDPRFNVIGGKTDRGKSAIYWAINWVVTNKSWKPRPWKRLKPKGVSSVELIFSDGVRVARVIDKGKNYYTLNGERLAGLTRGVPPDKVVKAMRLSLVNMQPQSDMFFLLNSTSGMVAKELNKIHKLDAMDSALNNARSRVKEAKKKEETFRKERKGLEEMIEELSWLDPCQKKFDEIMELTKVVDAMEDNMNIVKGLIDTITELEDELSEDFPSEAAIKEAVAIKESVLDIKAAIVDHRALADSISKAEELQADIVELSVDQSQFDILSDLSSKIESLLDRESKNWQLKELVLTVARLEESIEEAPPEELFIDAGGLIEDIEDLKRMEAKAYDVYRRLEQIEQMSSITEELSEAVREQERKLQEIRDTMEVCPTCMTVLKG